MIPSSKENGVLHLKAYTAHTQWYFQAKTIFYLSVEHFDE